MIIVRILLQQCVEFYSTSGGMLCRWYYAVLGILGLCVEAAKTT